MDYYGILGFFGSNTEKYPKRRSSLVRGVLTELPHVVQIKVGVLYTNVLKF